MQEPLNFSSLGSCDEKVSNEKISMVTGQLLLPACFLRGRRKNNLSLRTPKFSNQIYRTVIQHCSMGLPPQKPSQIGAGSKPTRFKVHILTAQIKTTQNTRNQLRNWYEIQIYEMQSDFQRFLDKIVSKQMKFSKQPDGSVGQTNTICLSLSSILDRLSFESSTSAASRSFSLSFLRRKRPDWKLLNILENRA